jgi:site-specific recombinase XerD
VRITAVRKLPVEAADNGFLVPELTRVKGVASKGVRLGNWLSRKQAQDLLNAPDIATSKGLCDRAILAVLLDCGLRRSEVHVFRAVDRGGNCKAAALSEKVAWQLLQVYAASAGVPGVLLQTARELGREHRSWGW